MKTAKMISTVVLTTAMLIPVKGQNTKNINNEIKEFAGYIEETIENGNPSFFNNSYDIETFFGKIVGYYNSEESVEYNKGFKEGLQTNFDLGSLIVDEISLYGSYSFVKSYIKNDKLFMLFRIYSINGINYHEFELNKKGDKFEIVDAYLYLSGEKISETVGRIYESYRVLEEFSESKRNADNSLLKIMSELGEIKEIAAEGNYKRALKLWEKQPLQIRDNKLSLITALNIAALMDSATFEETYKEYERKYPESMGKYLIPLSGFISHGNYKMALNCLEKLSDNVYNDPMLYYLQANIYFEMKDIEAACNSLRLLVNEIPDFEMGYHSLLELYLKEQKYLKATELLQKMAQHLNYYKEDINNMLQEYPDFRESSEFQSWENN